MSNNSTMATYCSFEEVDRLMTSLELVIYIPIFLMGLVLNTLALVVFCVLLRKWTESTIYMTNLALMDLLLLLLLPFKMHATNNQWSPKHRLLCSFLESMYFVGMYGSIYTIVCIAVDRWVAIKHPFRAKQLRSPQAALGTCVLVWFLTLGGISPIYGFRQAGDEDFHCFHGFSEKGWTPAVVGCLEVFGFLGPALVLVGCSVQSVKTLKNSGQERRACERIIYSSLCAFLLPFTPSHLAILLQFLVWLFYNHIHNITYTQVFEGFMIWLYGTKLSKLSLMAKYVDCTCGVYLFVFTFLTVDGVAVTSATYFLSVFP
ncbi:G-protein coupled receptor 55 isoform X1 [Osmerus eperlanus]|uniref:G-protein coupled receptor 55 isoform X1 n=1 Tax=Osmerus eperlanus TaxID=29151 RepID=UPI002E14AD1C